MRAYVNDELARLPESLRPMARDLLKVMVTSQATKAALDRRAIMNGLAESGALAVNDQAAEVQVEEALARLVNRRLVREFERGGGALYELAHDHMAAEIHTWIDQAELNVKMARELLRRELETWRSAGLLISRDALKLIHERRDDLRRLTQDELELVLRSAMAANYEVPYWRDRAPRSDRVAEPLDAARHDPDPRRPLHAGQHRVKRRRAGARGLAGGVLD